MILIPAGWQAKALAALAFVIACGWFALKLIGIGREQERGKAAGKALDAVKEANDVEARVDAAGAAERDELKKKWTRD